MMQSLRRFRRSLDRWHLELFKDGLGSDTLHAVMADLTADVTQGLDPRVRWFYALAGGLEVFDEAHELSQVTG